jgi:hypothetical protein
MSLRKQRQCTMSGESRPSLTQALGRHGEPTPSCLVQVTGGQELTGSPRTGDKLVWPAEILPSPQKYQHKYDVFARAPFPRLGVSTPRRRLQGRLQRHCADGVSTTLAPHHDEQGGQDEGTGASRVSSKRSRVTGA